MSNLTASSGDLALRSRNCSNPSIIITTGGVVKTTANARPAFIARGCGNTAQANDRVVLFSTVELNRYGCYNPASGIFTVPVSGLYHISYHLFLYHTNGTRYVTYLASSSGTTNNNEIINECTIEVPNAGTGSGYACAGASLNIFAYAGSSFRVNTYGGVISTNDTYAYFGAVYLGSSY